MKSVLVTGANGCVGSNLIARLVADGYIVRGFHRPTSNLITLEGIDFEHYIGDIRDETALRNAMRGCDTVFHTAAIVSYWPKRYREMMDVNVAGTRTVVNACLASDVQKLVHTSSVAALGKTEDGSLVDEAVAFNGMTKPSYRYSKHLAELEVLRGVQVGLNATLVNPSVIIGPRDAQFHGGKIIRSIKKGLLPAYVDGGMNVVSVHDVVEGHIAAALQGRCGERYLLGGWNLKFKEIFELTARIVGGWAPRVKVSRRFLTLLARSYGLFANATGTEPLISLDLLSGAGLQTWYSSNKAVNELGYKISPIEPAIMESYEWYASHGLL